MAACPQCGRENPNDARFCNACGAELLAPSAREVRKTVTVVFSDVTGSTSLGEQLDPESMRRIMARYFEAMREALEAHGGRVEKFIGDAVMAVFGIPILHEDDALRAVRAAVEMRERLAALNEELEGDYNVRIETRTGVNTGEVVAGEGETLVTGDAVNVAARLEQAAPPGEIFLGEATHRLVREIVSAEPVPPLELKGKEQAVAAHRLIEVLAGAPSRRLDSPMVGRVRERRRLQDAFETAVADRSCQLFTVLGAAGVGKSRLVEEFLDGLGGQALVARGRCLPYGEGITFWPLVEAVQTAVGLDDSDSPERGLGKLEAVFPGDDGAAALARRVGELIGLAEGGVGAEESFAAVRALFESLARRAPLVIVFDDIHWGEQTFLDLVGYLADWTRDAPLLLVCPARPELLEVRPDWGGGKLNATSVLLEPLSAEECAQLVDNLAVTELDESVRERIVGSAEGNPLFVEEMLALVAEDGRDEGELRVPPTIQGLLAARIDQLEERERAVVECASVQGKVFNEGAVVELAPEALRREVPEALGSLVRKELIRPERMSLGGETYRFRHLLIRDAAYDSIPKEARAELHESFGRWLERVAADRSVEMEEVVGYHFEQAFRYRAELGSVDGAARALAREGADRLGTAGRRAFVRSDAPAGVNLISRAVSLLPPEDPLRVDLVPSVRVVQGMTDLSWADRALTEAVEAAATTGDRQLAAHALVQRGFLRLFTESGVTADELVEEAERAIAVFEESSDKLGLARAWRLTAQANYLSSRAGACAEASERALEHARLAGDPFEQREIIEWLVIALFLGPAPAREAAARCERLLHETVSDPGQEVQLLGALALLVAMQGHTGESQEFFARGRRLIEELGGWIWLFSLHFAFISLWGNDPILAERELRPAYEALKKIGEKSHFSSMTTLLAQAVYAQGRYREAEELAQECEQAARPNDIHSQIIWRSTRAKVLARRGEFEAAERLGLEANAIAESGDFVVAHADALADLAEVLQLAGRGEDAAAHTARAIRYYELKGNVLGADRARARLEELRV